MKRVSLSHMCIPDDVGSIDWEEEDLNVSTKRKETSRRAWRNEQRAASIYAGTKPLTPDDIADAIYWVTTRPAHVNIDSIAMMPVCTGWLTDLRLMMPGAIFSTG